MSIMAPLVASQPSIPRLTVYDDAAGTRMEFSALTLDNWANKIANMLDEEFELAPDASVAIDLPVSWQAAVIALGAYTSARTPLLGSAPESPDVVFTSVDGATAWSHVPDVVVVSDDPFGRGVVESGGELPPGAVDFGPTVRFYGDAYAGDSPDLAAWSDPSLGPHRYLVGGWKDTRELEQRLLAPLAAGGSVVVVAGLVSADRLAEIEAAENVTHRLPAG